jgi:hypothetical protein
MRTFLYIATATALLTSGCGGNAARVAEVAPEDRDRVAKFLEAAGVRGEIAAVEDAGDRWNVALQIASEKQSMSSDGQNRLVEPPQIRHMYKADGRVVDPLAPPSNRRQR